MAGGEMILHHYDTSPFSEKPRLLFGLHGLAWRSVIQPNIMPKPDLTPLTGGYRRAPVMQIGADIFCDSQVIMAEINRQAGAAPEQGAVWAVNFWADRLFFQATVPVIFGELGDAVPKAFIEDRQKLSGQRFDIAAMKGAGVIMRGQWRAHAAWIDQGLAKTPFLAGDKPGLADIAAYMNVWFLRGALPQMADDLMHGLDRLKDWRPRVAAIGHGTRSEMTTGEALAAARTGEPAITVPHDASDPTGLQPGAAVAVAADDYGRDPIAGALVALNAERVVIDRSDPQLGRLRVHFPRAGYVVTAGAA
ncbi:MAG: glutathione S-transferase family protein [Caulobacterales bacterium]